MPPNTSFLFSYRYQEVFRKKGLVKTVVRGSALRGHSAVLLTWLILGDLESEELLTLLRKEDGGDLDGKRETL